MEDVRKSRFTISQAARHYGVPRKTVADHVNYEVVDFKLPGRYRMLSDEEEEAIVQYVLFMARRNLPLTRHDIRASIIVRYIC